VLMYCVLHKFNALYDGNWVRYYYYVRIEKMNWFSWANDVDHEGFNVGKLEKNWGFIVWKLEVETIFRGSMVLNFYSFD